MSDADGEVRLMFDGRDDVSLAVDTTAGLARLAADAREALGLSAPYWRLAFALKGEALEGAGSLADLGLGFGERVEVRVRDEYTAEEAQEILEAQGVDEVNAMDRLTEALQGGAAEELLRLVLAAEWVCSQQVVTGAVCESGVACLDLRACETLTTIGEGFLALTKELEELHLPASVEDVGNFFLLNSGVRSLDLSSLTGLRTLGTDFLADAQQLEVLHLPASVEVVDNNFLSNSGIRSLDLSALTRLRSVGANFLSDTKQLHELRFDTSAVVVGDCFLCRSRVKAVRGDGGGHVFTC